MDTVPGFENLNETEEKTFMIIILNGICTQCHGQTPANVT